MVASSFGVRRRSVLTYQWKIQHFEFTEEQIQKIRLENSRRSQLFDADGSGSIDSYELSVFATAFFRTLKDDVVHPYRKP